MFYQKVRPQHNNTPDAVSILFDHIKSGSIDKADKLWHSQIKKSNKSIKLWGSMMNAYNKTKKFRNCLELYHDMKNIKLCMIKQHI